LKFAGGEYFGINYCSLLILLIAFSSDGAEDGWNFPNNCPKAEVSFSKSLIQLLLAGLRPLRFFDEGLAGEKSWLMGVLG
jgi:hypothetical protein